MMKERDELDHKFGILFYSNLEIDSIVTKNNALKIYNVLELRNHAISLAKNVKESVTDLMEFNVTERTKNTMECTYCHIKSFCISVQAMDKTLNTLEKKEALLEEDEKKNKKNINSTFGLSDLKTYMVASRIASMENSRQKKLEINYEPKSEQNSRNFMQS